MDRKTFLKGLVAALAALASEELAVSRQAPAQTVPPQYATALKWLAAHLQGRLIYLNAPGYEGLAASANSRFDDKLPLAIAECASAADVSTCIQWAQKVGVPLATRGGGHNYEGASSTSGLLINTSLMNEISVDRATRTLVVQAGALNGTLSSSDLMLPIGTCNEVGVCGLTLGGGVGENARWAGMTCDRLRSTTMVLANGEIVTASETSHPDLFWAVRGAGGGNFRIHTELVYELVPLISPVTSVVELVYQGAIAAIEAFMAVDWLMQTVPMELNGFVFVSTDPGMGQEAGKYAGVADQPVGQPLDPDVFPLTLVNLNYQGPLEELQHLIQPLLDVAKTYRQKIDQQEVSFWVAQSDLLAVNQQQKHGFASASRFANRRLNTITVEALVGSLLEVPFAHPSKYASIELMSWCGGVVNTVPRNAMAYVHRSSTTIPRVSTWWNAQTPLDVQTELLNWMKAPCYFIQHDAQPESFQNFPNPLVTDWKTAYYAENLPTLIKVKNQYDPQNVFRYSRRIPVS